MRSFEISNSLKAIIFLSAAVAVIILIPGEVSAFHEGGEGFCEGCHFIHEPSGSYSLKSSDASSTCLRCHAESGRPYGVLSKDGSRFTPGGDFYWLEKTFIRIKNGITKLSRGNKHGHNITASEYGLYPDSVQSSAPGGDYPSTAMGCTSCHNPHGLVSDDNDRSRDLPFSEVGNFRLLGGIGYNGGNNAAGAAFSYAAPVAAADPEDWNETDNNHTAYGSGMSQWCSNCHDGFLHDSNKHLSGDGAELGNVFISNYNAYTRTGDISGSSADAYLSLVPFERGVSYAAGLDPSSTAGPGSGKAKVMCLTCHRAHASAFNSGGRWDFQATYIAESLPQQGDGGVTGNDVLNSYYGRDMLSEFGKYQRQLCNKCHIQD